MDPISTINDYGTISDFVSNNAVDGVLFTAILFVLRLIKRSYDKEKERRKKWEEEVEARLNKSDISFTALRTEFDTRKGQNGKG